MLTAYIHAVIKYNWYSAVQLLNIVTNMQALYRL